MRAVVIEILNLHVAIGLAPILHDVALKLPGATTAGLVGRNGAGKTTLMRAIMGLIPIQSGEIRFDGQDLQKTPPYHRPRLGIGYMPEDRRLIPELTVEENVLLPAWSTSADDAAQRLDWVYAILPEVQALRLRRAQALSGGQQKLVALARALTMGRRLLLLDEPFEGVAPVLARRLAEAIDRLKSEGLAILLSESDYTHSADLVSRLFVIERGVVAERSPIT